MSSIDLTDVWIKLRELDDKLDRVRGHVNVLSTLNKVRDRDALFAICQDKIGTSLDMKKLWYYADKPKSVKELAELAGVDAKKARVYLDRLNDRGVLDKHELMSPVKYSRDEISEGIGLEKWVEQAHKEAGETL